MIQIQTDAKWTIGDLILALEESGMVAETEIQFVTTKVAHSHKSGTCWCGCGTPTAKKFAPGHDSKFHSLAKKVARGQAVMPESFVCAEAEADFMMWVERTRNEDSAKGVASATPVLRPVAVVRSIEIPDELEVDSLIE
jgi:hypothetical protein